MQAAILRRTGRAESSVARAQSGTARRALTGSPMPRYMAGRVTDPATRKHDDACPACAAAMGRSCSSCSGGTHTGTVAGGGSDPWAAPTAPSRTAPTAGPARGAPAGGGVWPLHIVFDHFPFDKATLTAANYEKLETLSHLLRRLPRDAVNLMAIGHTDTSGPEIYNVGLSERRADTVADAIGLRVGMAVTRTGHGEREPVTNEKTEEDRARNRRVDVQISPGSLHWTIQTGDPEPKPKPVPEPTPTGEDTTFFCLRSPLHFTLCAAAAAGAVAVVLEGIGVLAGALAGLLGWLGEGLGDALRKVKRVIDCILHPKQCLLGPDDDDKPKPKEPPKPYACEASRALPNNLGPATMRYDPTLPWFEYFVPFEMEVSFSEDPTTGCACYCGEYRQEVKGKFEQNLGSGWTSMPDNEIPRMADGSRLDPSIFKEDAHQSGPYGRRLSRQRDDDGFHANQATGCHYHGEDKPGIRSTPFTDPLAPGKYRFHLAFRGAPVDACVSRTHIKQPWSNWEAIGPEITYPPHGGGTITTQQDPNDSGPIAPPGSGLATPLPAGIAVEMEKNWKADPQSLCLDDQISCGAGTLADELRRQGKPLAGKARDEAIAREAHALYAHCDKLSIAALHATGDSIEALAGRRLDNFLRWGEAVVDHERTEVCP